MASPADWTPYDPNWVVVPQEIRDQLPQDARDLYDLHTLRYEARTSPLAYGQTFGTGILAYPHVTFLSDRITALTENRLILPTGRVANKLLVTMPPRHGKSFLISEHTPPWYLTRFPDRRVILTSYEGDFAAQWGKKSKDLLRRTGPAFGLDVDPESKANSRWDLQGAYRGGMQTAGTGGPITGKGGHLLIGDDWVKNSDDARSPTWRENAWDWTLSTFLTRQEPALRPDGTQDEAKIILLMTRWHEDDPVGRLLAQEPDQWYHIDLPALARPYDPLGRPEGAALCRPRFTEEQLADRRSTIGVYWFEALYQGRPSPEGGGLFKADKVRYWRRPQTGTQQVNEEQGAAFNDSYVLLTPEGVQKYVRTEDVIHFLTVDLAATEKQTSDYTVFSTWGWTPDQDLLLVSRLKERILGPDHLERLEAYIELLRTGGIQPIFAGVEKATYGLSLIQDAIRSNFISIRELKPDGDKFARAIPAANILDNGRLYLPRDEEFTGDFLHEHLSFPNGTHDDQVDTTSYAAWVTTHLMPRKRRPGARRDPLRASTSIEDRLHRHVENLQRKRKAQRRHAQNRY